MSLSIYHTHLHSERNKERGCCCREIILLFWGFIFGVDSISEEVVGFFPLWFPQGKYLCSLSHVFDCCACYSLSYDPKLMLA